MRRPRWRRTPGRGRRLVVWLELTAGLAAFLGGAALIATWAFGLAVLLSGVAVACDALFRDDGQAPVRSLRPVGGKSHDQVIEEYRRAP